MTTASDLGPLDWRIAITDGNGRPTPEFQRRWNSQRNNNGLIGVTIGSGAPTSTPSSDGQEYLDKSATPPTLYVSVGGVWTKVGVYKFTQLSDVPNTYSGSGSKLVQVNSGGTGLVFTGVSSVLDLLGSTQGDLLYRGSSNWAALTPGTNGQFLTTAGASANPSWTTPPVFTTSAPGYVPTSPGGTTSFLRADGTWSAPTGSVTSVGLSAPGIFSVSGSPVTSSGTLALSLVAQSANLVWAGPSSGAAANPTFRSLVTADLPTTGVTAGSYTNANITIDATGRVTAASNGSSGSGTVTSVGLTAPVQFTVSGSPVTTSGTLGLSWVAPINNTVLAGQATPGSTPSIVNRGVYNSTQVSGNSIAMGFTPTTGNWLVCVYFNDDFTAPAAGTGWTRYAKFDDGNSFVSTGIYYQQVGGSPSSTITPVTGSAPANGAAIYELSGLPNGLPTDFVTSQFFANSTGSSPSFSAVSSSHTLELIVFSATRLGTGQTIAGTTYNATHNTGTGNARDVADAYVKLSPSTSVTPTITYSTSNNVGGGLVAINFDSSYAAPTFRSLVSADIPASVALTGVPTAPTNSTATDSSTQIATDAFVQAAIAAALADFLTFRISEDSVTRTTEAGANRIEEI